MFISVFLVDYVRAVQKGCLIPSAFDICYTNTTVSLSIVSAMSSYADYDRVNDKETYNTYLCLEFHNQVAYRQQLHHS